MPETRLQAIAKANTVAYATGNHYNTPQKARFKQAVEEFKLNGPTSSARSKSDIFKRFQIPRRSAYRLLAEESDRKKSH